MLSAEGGEGKEGKREREREKEERNRKETEKKKKGRTVQLTWPPPRLRVSGFGTQDHDAHRRRREALRRFFSRAAVGRIERDLHGLAQQLGDRVLATGGAAFGVQDAMSCFTSDGIGLHSFGEPLGFLARAAGRRRQRDGGGGGSGGADDNDDAFFLPNLRRASFPIFTTFFVFRWLDLARIVFERFGA